MGEVDKTLEKSASEMVVHPGPVYYRCLFHVQKVTGGWRPVIELLAMLLLLPLVWRWLFVYRDRSGKVT